MNFDTLVCQHDDEYDEKKYCCEQNGAIVSVDDIYTHIKNIKQRFSKTIFEWR